MANEVRWVITVPAIWRQQAKQFMREAAYQVFVIIIIIIIQIMMIIMILVSIIKRCTL